MELERRGQFAIRTLEMRYSSSSRHWIHHWMTAAILVTLTTDWFRGHVQGLSLAPIYWNTSNPLFKPSNKGHVIQVQPRDDIDFVCPYYANPLYGDQLNEYYVIYQVSRAEYDNCSISRSVGSSSFALLNCSSPSSKRRFTVIFDQFQAIPNIPEYLPGQIYYYISTSSGSINGIGSMASGSCATNYMKLAVYVCCHTDAPLPTRSTTTPSPTSSSSATPSGVSKTTTIVAHSRPIVATIDKARTSSLDGASTTPAINIASQQTTVSLGVQRRTTTGGGNATAQRLTNNAVDIKHLSSRQYTLFVAFFLVIVSLSDSLASSAVDS